MSKKDSGGDTNINYGEQKVGINKGNLTIVSPQPSVTADQIKANEKTEDGFVSEIKILIKDGYAAQVVGVKVEGETIQSGMLGAAGGVTMNVAEEVAPNLARFNAGPPIIGNEYIARVVTEKAENLAIVVAIK